MKINEKIYSLRKQLNLSQEELADKINVSRQTVSKWELGESTPDFDKIVPLCEVFNITPDELLTDKKKENNESETNEGVEKPDVLKATLICSSIFLYFIAIVFMIIGEEVLNLDDGLLAGSFITICGLATVIIIFACMTRPGKKKNKEEHESKKDPILKAIISIATLATTGIYLLISFLTGAWHITWIIWIIYAIVIRIIELSYSLKGGNTNEE